MAEVVIVPERALAEAGSRWIARRAEAALAVRGRFDVALAGGSTPRPLYQSLAGRDLEWPRIHVWFGDERCVPPEDPEANFRMVQETLLARVPVAWHRMEAER